MATARQAISRSDKPSQTRAPLEAELSETLKLVKSARNRRLVARYLGWDGRAPCSLKEAGAHFRLTRERARQVFAEVLPMLRQCDNMPTLDAVLAFIKKRQNELASDVEQDLRRRGFTAGVMSLHSVLRTAHGFGRPPGFQLHRVGGVLFVGDVSEVARRVLDRAVKTVGHHGAARVSDLRREASTNSGRPLDERLVRRILQTRSDISWLDQAGEWFWLTSIARNRLLTRVQKVLAVKPRIDISTLHQAISRDYKPLRIPEPVLRSLCGHFSWCRVGRHHVEARIVPRVEEILSGGEAIICAILRDCGGAMPLPQLEKVCSAAGVRRANLWRVLSFSPLIRRFDREIYGLIGAEAAAKQATRRRRASRS